VIKIPPGACVPEAGATTATTATPPGTAPPGTEAAATATTQAGLGDNCVAGSYTLEAGDYPNKVAQKFDVTVDQLNAANANTPGYSSFYVGLEIVIPAKDC
jgi:LysM repeat protein